ncbi:MAG: hypothetical protein AAF480_09480 [Actinomycetota bacterium]
MDRASFIASLRLGTIRPMDLVAFYRGLPRRVPSGNDEEQVAARRSIERQLATVNAITLGREPDLRVPVDIEEMSTTVADRLDRFTSADWARGNPSYLDAARTALAEILAELRAFELDDEDEDDD